MTHQPVGCKVHKITPTRTNKSKETNKLQRGGPPYTLFSGFPIFHHWALALSFLFFLSFIITSPTSPSNFHFLMSPFTTVFGLFWVKKQTQNNVRFKERKTPFTWLLLQQFKVLMYLKNPDPLGSPCVFLHLMGPNWYISIHINTDKYPCGRKLYKTGYQDRWIICIEKKKIKTAGFNAFF